MVYRTRTYIAGDWENDKDAVDQLHKWNNDKRLNLSFTDAHDLKQARDSSLNCSIKRSLAERLNASKIFVLIVGDKTNSLRAGSCQYCESKNHLFETCSRGNTIDHRSFIEYECEKAVKDGLKIIVLYKSTFVDKQKCPKILRHSGYHTAMLYESYGRYYWNYQAVEEVFNKQQY